jgi:hypothetical protein
MTLASSLPSVLNVPVEHAVPINAFGLSGAAVLKLAATHLVAAAIIEPLFAGQKVLVHNAQEEMTPAIEFQAAKKQIQATFMVDGSDQERDLPSSWIQLPPYAGKAEVSQLLPTDVTAFVGFSVEESDNEQTILSVMSPYCRRETASTIYSPRAVQFGTSTDGLLGETLKAAVQYAQDSHPTTAETTTVPLETIAGKERPHDPLTVVDWTTAAVLPARVTRFDIIPLFKNDKTYWLCGLSGALGISLCDWMIDRGVKYLVLTSRNPKINQEWIDNHAANGVTIRTLSW